LKTTRCRSAPAPRPRMSVNPGVGPESGDALAFEPGERLGGPVFRPVDRQRSQRTPRRSAATRQGSE
jgi:hypothetical protein